MANPSTRTFADFAAYLVGGEHWRLERAIKALRKKDPWEVEPWMREGHVGFHMHATQRQGAAVAGLETSNVLDEFVQAGLESQTTDHQKRKRDWYRVKEAIDAVRDDRPEEIAVLEAYIVPEHRRRGPLFRVALDLEIGERTMRAMRDRALILVWEEMGGLW
jgi:hypothetical protein